MPDTTERANACPLCGEPNLCGIAQGKGDCWCFDAPVPDRPIAGLAEEDRSTRCLCQRCLDAATTPAPEPSADS